MGQPDLSGFWSNATMTPLTREGTITMKPELSAAEAQAFVERRERDAGHARNPLLVEAVHVLRA